MFGSTEDDDFGPVTVGSSKLASLFGSEARDSHVANQSLSYSAPKQPKPPAPPSNQTHLLLPTNITAYKISDGQYHSQGRLNTALVANIAKSDYRIIIYQGSDKQIAQAAVHEASQLSLSRSQYLSVLDSQNQYWSLLFDSTARAHAFLRQLAVLMHLQSGGQRLIKFDLSAGEGAELGAEDSAESPIRFRLGRAGGSSRSSAALPGFDRGLPGMRKGSSRLLVLPAGMAFGSAGNSANPTVPPNATVVCFVELLRVKQQQQQPPPPPPPVEKSQNMSGDDSSVISEKGETSEKAKLLSRMAKMG
uniref:peptidylprolyl isomerase n=1 Tax=Macrostomum lignano TaxID=282301 RepID=A0A1I8H9Z2_9PLAT